MSKHRSILWSLLSFSLLFLLILLLPRMSWADPSDAGELRAVWERVHQSGAYQFSADVTQHVSALPDYPGVAPTNEETRVYLEGETDLAAESLALTLWDGGGTAARPETGTQIEVSKGEARARRGGGPWQSIDDFSGSFAPGGDFLAMLSAAKNVVRHGTETGSTPLGEITVTRFTFDIDGPRYATLMRDLMKEQMVARGELVPRMKLDLPAIYARMTGSGELLVGEDGLPVGQRLDLTFPDPDEGTESTAQVDVTFSNFGGEQPIQVYGSASPLSSLWQTLGAAVHSGHFARFATIGLVLLTVMLLALILIEGSRSRRVYIAVALSVTLSMVLSPLMNGHQVTAAYERRAVKVAIQEDQQEEADAASAWQEALNNPNFDPHQSPLALGEARAEAMRTLQTSGTISATSSSSTYFDSSCETNPNDDNDGDSLTNLEECLIGTLPSAVDTDKDGVNDNLEVKGFVLDNGTTTTWYTNPLYPDTNRDQQGDGTEWNRDADGDGIPDDTDGDGVPDLWDDDNDGDGVPDDLDLSPFTTTKDTKTFDGDNPLQLIIDDLGEGLITKVDFQLSPTNPEHLWYTNNVLDWNDNDRQGQMQDADGLTFYDVDNTLDPSPNDLGDVRLVPMLEIEITGTPDNLPEQSVLKQFGISVLTETTTTQVAYVPVTLVTDATGEENVAFQGSMFYRAGSSWGNAHSVRLVWIVQALVDVCETYDNGICSSYSQYNDLQPIHDYDEEWYLTGMQVTEDSGANIAAIYEDPAVATSDMPLYVDTLYPLAYGLDRTFMAGADCEVLDDNDDCVSGDGTLDLSVSDIATRFDHTTNGSITDEERWGLPNVLSVQEMSYDSVDLAMMDTVVTQTETILESTFTSVWSASGPITPTIMFAWEHTYRAVSLSSDNLSWSDNTLTVDVANGGDNAVPSQQSNGMKWAPYSYTTEEGWSGADMGSFWDDLDVLLPASFSGEDDIDAYVVSAKYLYLGMYSGEVDVVEYGDYLLSKDYQTADKPLQIKLAEAIGAGIKKATALYYGSYATRALLKSTNAQAGDSLSLLDKAKFSIQRNIQAYYSLLEDSVGMVGIALLVVVSVAALVVAGIYLVKKFVAHDSLSNGWVIAGGVALGVLAFIVGVLKPVLDIVKTVRALLATGDYASSSEVLGVLLKGEGAPAEGYNFIGLVVDIGISIGIFIALLAAGQVKVGTIAFNTLIAQTIAAIIVAFLFYVLNFTVFGALLLGVAVLIDLILFALGINFSITGKLTEAIASVIYQFDLSVDTGVESGGVNTELVNPDDGMEAGNEMVYSFPITTAITQSLSLDLDASDIQSNSFVYELAPRDAFQTGLSTSKGDRALDWRLTRYDYTYYFQPAYLGTLTDTVSYQVLLEAGVNRAPTLYLNSAYDLLGESCWVYLTCSDKYVSGSSSNDIGSSFVFDVYPATVEEFVDVTSWSNGNVRFPDADGDGLLPLGEGGVDPDDSTWDLDGDSLSDAFELSMRSLTADQGGELVDPALADSDGDGIQDKEELLLGTNPANPDSDGDGLPDIDEAARVDEALLALTGGWLFAYRIDAFTRVWSDPNNPDYDGDGMTDLFEQTQDTCPSCDPWADPDNPQLYSPYVYNENPVPLYVDDNTNDGFVSPSSTFVYTTTTENNLSSGISLEGEVNLELPDIFSGAPLTAQVAMSSGYSETLVSELAPTVSGSVTGVLTSSMSLAAVEDVVWSWDPTDTTSTSPIAGEIQQIDTTAAPGFSDLYVSTALEVDDAGTQYITVYAAGNSGNPTDAAVLATGGTSSSFSAPSVACNDDGVCLVVQTDSLSGLGDEVYSYLLQGNVGQSSTLVINTFEFGTSIAPPAVATDGDNFMVVYAEDTGSQVSAWVKRVDATGVISSAQQVWEIDNPGVNPIVVGIVWAGSTYLAVWIDAYDGTMYRAEIDTSLNVGPVTQLPDEGYAFIRPSLLSSPLPLVYDPLSEQALIIYGDVDNSTATSVPMVAQRLSAAGASAEIILDSVDNAGGKYYADPAICADPLNGGWIVAWSKNVFQGEKSIHYQAIAPDGSLRGSEQIEPISISNAAVALGCRAPHPLLDLEFDEDATTGSYADSSQYGHDALCEPSTGTCPTGGVGGRFGNGVSFDGVNDQLVSQFTQPKDDFTLELWIKTTCPDCAILTHLGTNSTIYLQDGELCLSVNGSSTTSDAVCTDEGTSFADGDWHHVIHVADDQTHKIYVDGQFRKQVVVSYHDIYCIFACDLFIMGNNSDSYYEGSLDRVLLHDRVLSDSELQEAFSAAVTILDLDETAGATTAYDASNNGFNATCSGDTCPTFGVDGVASTAALFDGVDDYLEIDTQKRTLETVVYDFEDSDTSGWSQGVISTAVRNDDPTQYLGSFSNSPVTLDLVNLPTHDTVAISFDLYVIGSWDGTRTDWGPDVWTWGYDDTTLLSTTFSNMSNTAPNYQTYPADDATVSFRGITLYENEDQSGVSETFTADDPDLSDNAIGNDSASAYVIRQDTASILYEDINYGGDSWIMDPKHGTVNVPTNDTVSSLRVFSALHSPKYGSTGDSLTVNGYSEASVYHIDYTLDAHTADSLSFFFDGDVTDTGYERWGLDNVVVEVQSDGSSVPLTDSSFTLAGWAKRDSFGNDDFIISQGTAVENEGLNLSYQSTDYLRCAIYGQSLDSSVTYSDNEWHHVACTLDVDTGLQTLYRDGVQVGQQTTDAVYSGFGTTYIGKRFDDIGHFSGALDEIAIWTEALSADQILELYQKVKIEDESVLHAIAPVQDDSDLLTIDLLLRETATDAGSESQDITTTIGIDNDAPSTLILAPTGADYVTGLAPLELSGSATDPTSSIATVEVRVDDGSWVSATGTETWSTTIPAGTLGDGVHTVEARATDVVDNTGDFSSVEFIVDDTAPDITIATSGSLRPIRDDEGRWLVPVSGTASDPAAGTQPGSGLVSVEVLLEGGPEVVGNGWQTATLSGSDWSLEYVLPEVGTNNTDVSNPSGDYTVTVRATDAVGNTTPEASYVTEPLILDINPPEPTLDTTLLTTQTITTALTLSGQILDASLIDSVEISFMPGGSISSLNEAVVHLPFEENQSLTQYFADRSGANNPAGCSDGSCPEVGQSGQRGLALAYDGVSDHLVGDGVDLSDQSFTVAAWAKRDVTGQAHTIVSHGTPGTNEGFILLFQPSDQVTCSFWANNLTSPFSYPDTDWHHWACSYDAATGLRSLYRDGITVAQDSPGSNYLGSGNFYVGRRQDDVRYFDGLIDELVIHDRALEDYEIADLYSYGQTTWEPVTFDSGALNPSWSYTLPEGADGIEGVTQIIMRATDVLGNVTELDSQRLWRGAIDTRSPYLEFDITIESDTTRYMCNAVDFSLDEATSCEVVPPDTIPTFSNEYTALVTYDEVDQWYASTISDTSRLFQMVATEVLSGTQPTDMTLQACDEYGRCTTATAEVGTEVPDVAIAAGLAEPLARRDSVEAPPLIAIIPTVLTETHQIGTTSVQLAGVASDAVDLYKVEVSVGGDPWTMAGLQEDGDWHWPWQLDGLPDGESYEVSARATNVDDQTTEVTESVLVDIVSPSTVDLGLAYENSQGELLPIAEGATLTDAVALEVSWSDSSDGSGIAGYYVAWSQSPVVEDLVVYPYPGSGSHTQAVGEAETWYAHLRIVDGVGNVRTQTAGPVYVDGVFTPDVVDDLSYHGWATDTCTLEGVDRRLPQANPDLYADEQQQFYVSWDEDDLRLYWQGANWNHDGDLFVYLDTRPGGSDRLYNPYPEDAETTIYLPGNVPDPADGVGTRQLDARASLAPDAGQSAMGADYMVWVEGTDAASLYRWEGSGWIVQQGLGSDQFELNRSVASSDTDLRLPFDQLQIADPTSAALGLVAVATEEDALQLWSTMPVRNPLNSERVVNPIAGMADEHTFPLVRGYFWNSLGSGLCGNGRLSGDGTGPTGGPFADSDLQLTITADPVGTTYSFLNDELAWLWTILFGFESVPVVPSVLFDHYDTDHPPLGPGDTVTYTIDYVNLGSESARDVIIELDAWFSLRLTSDSTVALGDIAAGATGSVQVTGVIDPTGVAPDEQQWAALDGFVYDEQYPENPSGGSWSSAPLEWLWADHAVDVTAPTEVTITSPDFVIPAREVTVRGTVVDDSPVPSIDVQVLDEDGNTETVSCADETPTDGRWQCTWDPGDVGDGETFQLRARAVDSHGQLSDWGNWIAIVVDATAPTFTVVKSSQPLGEGIHSVNGLFVDERNIGSVYICREDNECSTHPAGAYLPPNTLAESGLWATYLLPPLDYPVDGHVQTVTLYAEDKAGNRSEPITQSYQIDNTPPRLIVGEVAGSVPAYGSHEVMSGKVSDGSHVDVNVLVQPPNGSTQRMKAAVSGNDWSFTASWTVLGTYTLRVQAVDAAGNATTVGPYLVTVTESARLFLPTVHRESAPRFPPWPMEALPGAAARAP